MVATDNDNDYNEDNTSNDTSYNGCNIDMLIVVIVASGVEWICGGSELDAMSIVIAAMISTSIVDTTHNYYKQS